jgi:lipid-binding SYLF domain-containing protein
MGTPEQSIPDSLLAEAQCVAVIPGVKKVGFGFGGRYGRGLVSCRTEGGWSRASFVSLAGGSIGLQIGAQSTDFVMVFSNEQAARRLLERRFTMGGDASVSAGPVGRTVEAGTDVKLQTEIYSYSRSRGLFAGASLEGASLATDKDANEDVYGRGIGPEELLFGRGGALPAELAAFVRNLEKFAS